VGEARVAAEADAVETIIAGCARLPLALVVVAALVNQRTFPLATLAAKLDGASWLDALDAGDSMSQVRAVFSWSYTALSRPAARLFRLLGRHPGPDISTAAAASVAGAEPLDACQLLTELTRANLLTEHAPGRYTCHDLLRSFAAEVTLRHDTADERSAATTRLFDAYAHTAHTAARQLHSGLNPIYLPLVEPAPGASIEHLAGHGQAMAWLVAEHPVLLGMIGQAASAGHHRYAWQLAWSLHTFLDRQGQWHQLAEAWRLVLGTVSHLDDSTVPAYAHRRLANAETRLGHYAEADAHLRCAMHLYDQAACWTGVAYTHEDLALLWERRGRPEKALEHTERALSLHQAPEQARGRASALNNVGWYHAQLGQYAQALSYCRQALALFRELRDRDGEAAAWDSLGYAHHHAGDHDQAARCYRRALRLRQDLDDRYNQAETLTHLGDAHQAAADASAARTAWRQALAILTTLHHPDADRVRARLALAASRTRLKN
jgi:tetratricopeptide (TPR) repeat protein